MRPVNFGSMTIETEHLLLGLLREDKNLIDRFLRNSSSIESIRKEVEGRTTIGEKVPTTIDLPLSNECKRILRYANEEAERLNHWHIGTEHFLLGILREEKCVAARDAVFPRATPGGDSRRTRKKHSRSHLDLERRSVSRTTVGESALKWRSIV